MHPHLRPLWQSAALDLSTHPTPAPRLVASSCDGYPLISGLSLTPLRSSATRPITLPIPLSPTFTSFFLPAAGSYIHQARPLHSTQGDDQRLKNPPAWEPARPTQGLDSEREHGLSQHFILARLRRIHWLTGDDKRLLRTGPSLPPLRSTAKKASCNHCHSLCGASLFERHLLSVACRSLPGVLGCQGVPGVARPARVRSSPQRQNPGSGGV